MVVGGKHVTIFACCGLVVEIPTRLAAKSIFFAPLPTSTKLRSSGFTHLPFKRELRSYQEFCKQVDSLEIDMDPQN